MIMSKQLLGPAFLAVSLLASGCSTIHEEKGLQIRESVVYGIPNILSYKHERVSINKPRLYGGLLGQMFQDYLSNFKNNPHNAAALKDMADTIAIIKAMYQEINNQGTSPERRQILTDVLQEAAAVSGYPDWMALVLEAHKLTYPAAPSGCDYTGMNPSGQMVLVCGPTATPKPPS